MRYSVINDFQYSPKAYRPLKKGATAGLSSSAEINSPKTLLDKPAVAPKYSKIDFFNRLLAGGIFNPSYNMPTQAWAWHPANKKLMLFD
jgi:hypothetical protein